MTRTLFVAFLACLSTTFSLFAGFSQAQDFRPATPAELAMKSAPSAPGAAAAILDYVKVADHKSSVASEYYRIKVFSEEGRKHADVEVPFFPGYPSFSRVTDVAARTIQPDGTITPFDGKVYEKVLFKSGGREIRAKTFTLAGVQPGSILEYRYQVRWKEFVLFDEEWIVQREIPVMHARLSLKPLDTEGQFSSYFTFAGLPEGKTPKLMRDTYELEVENIAPFADEAFAPPLDQLKARVDFHYADKRIRPDQFWDLQAAEWSKTIEKFIGSESAYRQHVVKGANPMATLGALYAKTQALRNLTFAGDGTDEASAKGADVLSRGAGYSSEINRAFVGLARAAGFDAVVVRVAPRNRGFFTNQVLDGSQLADEVAAVVVDGKVLYFDPGTAGAPFGVLSWEKANVPGMRISKSGALQWVKVDEARAESAVMQRKADLRVNGDVLEGTITISFHGQEALRRRANTWSDDDATRMKGFEKEAKEWLGDGATVKLDELTGLKTHEGPLVAKYSVTIPTATAGSRITVPLSLFAAAQKNPFAPATRTNSVYFHYPHRTDDEITLTIPATLAPAALPEAVSYDVGAMKYSSAASREGGAVTFKRSMTVDAMLVEARHYNALRNFYNSVVAADQRPLLLIKSN